MTDQLPASENPFAQLDPDKVGDLSSGQSAKPAANPFAELDPDKVGDLGAPKQHGMGSTFLHGAERGVAPMVAGMAASGPGAMVGAPVGAAVGGVLGAGVGALLGGVGAVPGAAVGASWGGSVGGFLGGFGGFMAGSAAAEKAQDYALKALPESFKEAIGQDEATQRAEQAENPRTAMIAGLAPYLLTMKPGAWEKAAAELGKNATPLQQIMAHPVTSRIFGGAVMGGMDVYGDWKQGQPIDWTNAAISTGFGLIFNKPNQLGQSIERAGERAFTAPARMFGAKAAQEAPAPPPNPTLADAMDAKIIGPGIDEAVSRGGLQQAPEAEAAAQATKRAEMQATGEQTPEDAGTRARQMHPDLFADYAKLTAQRAELGKALSDPENPPSPVVREALKAHFDKLETQVQEMAPQVAAAHRRAAESLGAETVPPAAPDAPIVAPNKTDNSAPLLSDIRSPEQQRDWIAADVTRRLIATGRNPEQATAEGQIRAAYYETQAARFKGALGTAEQLYSKIDAAYRGPDGIQHPPGVAPVDGGTANPPSGTPVQNLWNDFVARRKESRTTPDIETSHNRTTTRAGSKLRVRKRQEWTPGNIVDVGLVKNLLVAAEPYNGAHVLVGKPNAEGKSPAYSFRPHEGLTRLDEPVDFRAIADNINRRPAEAEPAIEEPAPASNPAEKIIAEAQQRADEPPAQQSVAPEEPKGLVERIPGKEGEGTEVLIIKRDDGRFSVVFRDLDSQQTVGGIHIVQTIERARESAHDMIHGPKAETPTAAEPAGKPPEWVPPIGETVHLKAGNGSATAYTIESYSAFKDENGETKWVFHAKEPTGSGLTDSIETLRRKAEEAKPGEVPATPQLPKRDFVVHPDTPHDQKLALWWDAMTPSEHGQVLDAADVQLKKTAKWSNVSPQKIEKLSKVFGSDADPMREVAFKEEPRPVDHAEKDPFPLNETIEAGNPTKKYIDWLASASDADVEKMAAWGLHSGAARRELESRKAAKAPESEPAPAPKAAEGEAKTDAKGRKLVGKNESGRDLWEDARGVRSYVENGIRVSEPVRFTPGSRDISVDRAHNHEWATAEEHAAKSPEPAVSDPHFDAARHLVEEAKDATGNARAEADVRKKLRDLALKVEDGSKASFALDIAATRLGMGEGNKKRLEFAPKPEPEPQPAQPIEQQVQDFLDGKRDTPPEMPAASAPEPVAEPQAEPVAPAYGANNKLFTADRHAAVRERLRQKLRDAGTQLNAGVDMEFLQLGTEVAGFHIEAGSRSFAAFAHAVAADLGAKLSDLRPYLRSWYNGARDMMEELGHDITGMDDPDKARTEQARILKEEEDAGTAIHREGAGPLEGIPPESLQGNAEGGLPERDGAGGEQGSGGTDRRPDAGGLPETRGGGNGSAGNDLSAAGKVARTRKKRTATINTETKAKNPAFDESPSVTEHETAKANIPDTDFVLTDDMNIGKGTEGEKYADNLAAIRTLKLIEAEDRRATPEEKGILARYIGWGGLKNAFRVAGAEAGEGIAKGWEKRVAELEGLLTPAELRRARNSTGAAHYTSPTVVKAIWQAVDRLGFAGGSVLEPSVGSGNFLGFMPEAARGKSSVFAVEYDNLTARIAQKLYPNADIVHSGFQDVPLPKNQFALAIGNPPFGKDMLHFRYNPAVNGRTIHNQFFLSSLDGVRPGGMMAMVVSHNMMDALDNSARLQMARQGEFLGAIRLPDTAFKENARTEVVTDIIFLKKREATEYQNLNDKDGGAKASPIDDAIAAITSGDEKVPFIRRVASEYQQARDEIDNWIHSSEIDDPAGSGEKINANGYFLRHPEMVIGKMDASGTMNRRAGLNVRLENPAEFPERLAAAIERLPRLDPNEAVAAASLVHYKTMAEGMKLTIAKAEPGKVRQVEGGLKTIVDIDGGEGSAKSLLREIPLTADTPFKPEYSMNMDGKWQVTRDVLGDDGKPLKVVNDSGKITNRNQKQTVVFDNEADIPEKDRLGQRNVDAIKAMLPIRDAFKRQLQLEMEDAPQAMMDENRAQLNAAYDKFVTEHGELHDKANEKLALSMPDGGNILAVEQVNKDGSREKAAIMSRRVTEPPKPIEKAKDASDAIAISLSEHGRIDIDRVASLLGTDEAGAIKALSEGERPRAFLDPETNRWETSDQYLTGLVGKKLLAAKEAGLEGNVKALEKVLPKDLDSSEITPNLGSSWIPADVYAGFLKHLGYDNAFVHYSEPTNTFSVSAEGRPKPEWETSAAAFDPDDIVSKTLNSQPVKVTWKDDDGRTHVDEEATAESQAKASELFNEFLDWAYQDDDQRARLCRIYNDKFNTRVVGQRDGSHLTMPGKVPDEVIKMRRHQMNAIWRGITDRAVLYDHVVGAGKTFTAIARIMERRRMGLTNKALIAVPNHLVGQWEEDIHALYPGANVLAAGKADFEGVNRRKLFAKIAAGDYDMTVIGHSSLGFIDIDPSTEQRYLQEELESAQAAITAAQEAADEEGYSGWGKPMGVREAERLVTKIETRMAKLGSRNRDRLLTFEEMGVDDLTIDEAHEFKNLAYSSRLQGVSGMGNKAGSQKATDLNLKVRALQERPGTGVAFLTGTPISNSVSEMYLLLRNLVPKEMKELGIENFDAWRSMYVNYSTAFEPTPAGGLKETTRLGREWMNMKSLMDLYYSVSDAVTMDDIKKNYSEDNGGKDFPIPKVASKAAGGGDREMVLLQPTDMQKAVLLQLVEDFKNLPHLDIKERGGERFRLWDRSRKIALDPRAVEPRAVVPDGEGKIGAVVDRVHQIYHKWDADKGTQIVFLDRSVPQSKGDAKIIKAYDDLRFKLKDAMESGDEDAERKVMNSLEKYDPNEMESLRAAQAGGWNAYDDIKRQLVAKGIPENEIRFVQEANNDKEKAALFNQVKGGEVRVLIGSTQRMGAGTNVQDRLVALHHVDVTWKPSDIEQREGRIVRQKNKLLDKYGPDFAVDVIAYATERTMDATMWSLNAGKLKAINGVRKYDGASTMEFEDEEAADMAHMAALATGNPKMVERVTLTSQIAKMEIQQRAFSRRLNAMRDRLSTARRRIETGPEKAAGYRAFADSIDKRIEGVRQRSAQRSVMIEGKPYDNMWDAAAAAADKIKEIRGGDAKARFSIDIGGEKVTSQDAVEMALRKALGSANFEAKIDGETFIDHGFAAAAIAKKAQGKSGEFTLDGIEINGIPVEVDVSPFKYATKGKDEQEICFSALNDKGQQMAGYRAASSGLTWGMANSGLGKLLEQLKPDQYRYSAFEAEAYAKQAKDDVPGLEAEVAKPWDKAEELQAKRARLKEVSAELKDSDDAAALAGAQSGGTEEPSTPYGEPPEDEARTLNQTALGKTRFANGQRTILDLFEHANASTFMHETGHEWLENLMSFATHPQAPESIRQDAQIARDWLKNSGGKITDAQHEKFARGFEQYLREGVAPSRSLAGVFGQFKNWLTQLYQTIKGLGRPINADIRGVFDRMLAIDPQPTVVAAERAAGPTIHDIHEADAAETEPQHAEPALDRVMAETEQKIQQLTPEVQNVIAPVLAKIEAAQAAGAEPPAEGGAGAERRGEVDAGGGGPQHDAGGGGGGDGDSAKLQGGGQSVAEGAGVSEPASGRQSEPDAGHPLAGRPVVTFGASESPFLDKAGNIRLDTLTDKDSVAKAVMDSAERNDNFTDAQAGPMTKGQMMDLSETAGVPLDQINERHLGEMFGGMENLAPKVLYLRKLIVTSATEVSRLSKAFAETGDDNALQQFTLAIARHDMIQSTLAGVTASWGRTGSAFHNLMSGWGDARELNQLLKENTGRDLFQMRKIAKLASTMETPEQVSKFVSDAKKPGFRRMVLEYWINGLISGPATHSTYMIGNTLLAVEKAGPETAAAALIGSARKAMGREGDTVRMGEVGAQMKGAAQGFAPALNATIDAFKSGVTTLLPGDNPRINATSGAGAMPMQPGADYAPAGHLDLSSDMHSVIANLYGSIRGGRDAFLAGAALIKAGGVDGAPLFGTQDSPLGSIPDLTLKGVNVLPIGSAARLPGRFIAAIHSFFRSINYSMDLNAQAYRQAAGEGLGRDEFAARLADMRQNPSEAMMNNARGVATDLTLMGQGSAFVQKLSQLTNTEIFGFPYLKFVDPFVHIAGNVLDQSLVQRSPVGLLTATVRADLAGKNGSIAQDTAMAKMLCGTVLGMAMGGLASQGLASGSGPSDPRKAAMWRLAGNQAHSVRIGDIWYDTHRLGPLGMLASVSADLYDVARKAQTEDAATVASLIVHAFTQNILDESFMRGPAELMRALEDSDRYGAAYARNMAASFTPYSVGMSQIARARDPYARQARTVMDAIKQKIPGMSEELMPRRDIWGEPMLNPDALGAAGVTAIYERQMSHDPVNAAMVQLGIGPAPVERKIRNVELTEQQYDDFARIAGRATKQRLDVFVKSAQWPQMPPEIQRKLIEETITKSREMARGYIMAQDRSIPVRAYQLKMEKMKGKPID